jgi:GT2 family glycosyltransferase
MNDTAQPAEKCPLLIVIVNYRTADLTINCLHSLVGEVKSLPGTQVVVVDNPSGDDSVARIQQAIATEGWQSWVSLVAAERNGGFAYGNNLAVRSALQSPNPPDYYWLLNPDTLVRPGSLKALVDFITRHPNVGIVGSSFEEADGKPWPFTFRFPTILSELDSGLQLGIVTKLLQKWTLVREMDNQPAPVDWLPGASMMIRREVFESVGLMDEAYFLYYEETDFCLQARRAGWSCWYVPQSRIMHIAGQSTGVTVRNAEPKRLPQYWFDSRRRYFMKNHGWLYSAVADATWLAGYVLWRCRRVIQRKPDTDPPHLLEDFLRNTVFVKPNMPG